jgi:hypothetical protein
LKVVQTIAMLTILGAAQFLRLRLEAFGIPASGDDKTGFLQQLKRMRNAVQSQFSKLKVGCVSKILGATAVLGVLCINRIAEAQSSEFSKRTATYPCNAFDFGPTLVSVSGGGFRDIKFASESDRDAVATLSSLKLSVICGALPFPEKHRGAHLFLVGRMAKHITPKDKYVPPGKEQSGLYWKFIIQGWFLKVPYWEIPQIPDYEKPQADILRRELLPKDLEDPKLWGLIKYDPRRKLYCAGVDPSSAIRK